MDDLPPSLIRQATAREDRHDEVREHLEENEARAAAQAAAESKAAASSQESTATQNGEYLSRLDSTAGNGGSSDPSEEPGVPAVAAASSGDAEYDEDEFEETEGPAELAKSSKDAKIVGSDRIEGLDASKGEEPTAPNLERDGSSVLREETTERQGEEMEPPTLRGLCVTSGTNPSGKSGHQEANQPKGPQPAPGRSAGGKAGTRRPRLKAERIKMSDRLASVSNVLSIPCLNVKRAAEAVVLKAESWYEGKAAAGGAGGSVDGVVVAGTEASRRGTAEEKQSAEVVQAPTEAPAGPDLASDRPVMTTAAAVALTAAIEAVLRYSAHLGYNACGADPGTTDSSDARGRGKHRLTARAVQAALRQCTDPVLDPVQSQELACFVDKPLWLPAWSTKETSYDGAKAASDGNGTGGGISSSYPFTDGGDSGGTGRSSAYQSKRPSPLVPKSSRPVPPPPQRRRTPSKGDGIGDTADDDGEGGGKDQGSSDQGIVGGEALPLRQLLERLANTRAELRMKAAMAVEQCAALSDGRDHAGLHVGVAAMALSPTSKVVAENAWSLQQSMRALHGQRDPADGKVVLVLPEDPWKGTAHKGPASKSSGAGGAGGPSSAGGREGAGASAAKGEKGRAMEGARESAAELARIVTQRGKVDPPLPAYATEEEDEVLEGGVAPSLLDVLDAPAMALLDDSLPLMQHRGLDAGHILANCGPQDELAGEQETALHADASEDGSATADSNPSGAPSKSTAGQDSVGAIAGSLTAGNGFVSTATDVPAPVGQICDSNLALLPVDAAACLWTHPADVFSLGAADHDGMPGASRVPIVPDATEGALACLAAVARATLLSICTRLATARAARSQMLSNCMGSDGATSSPPPFSAMDVAAAVLSVLRSDAVAEAKDIFSMYPWAEEHFEGHSGPSTSLRHPPCVSLRSYVGVNIGRALRWWRVEGMPSPSPEVLGQVALAEPTATTLVFPAPPRTEECQQPRSSELSSRDLVLSASLGARLTVDTKKPAAATIGSLLNLAADKLGSRRDDLAFGYRGYFMEDRNTPAECGADLASIEASWCLVPVPVLRVADPSKSSTRYGGSSAESGGAGSSVEGGSRAAESSHSASPNGPASGGPSRLGPGGPILKAAPSLLRTMKLHAASQTTQGRQITDGDKAGAEDDKAGAEDDKAGAEEVAVTADTGPSPFRWDEEDVGLSQNWSCVEDPESLAFVGELVRPVTTLEEDELWDIARAASNAKANKRKRRASISSRVRKYPPSDTEVATGALLIALHAIAPAIARRSLRVAAQDFSSGGGGSGGGSGGPVGELAAWRLGAEDAEELGVPRPEPAPSGPTASASGSSRDRSEAISGAGAAGATGHSGSDESTLRPQSRQRTISEFLGGGSAADLHRDRRARTPTMIGGADGDPSSVPYGAQSLPSDVPLFNSVASLHHAGHGHQEPVYADPTALFGIVALLKRHAHYSNSMQAIWVARQALDRTRCLRTSIEESSSHGSGKRQQERHRTGGVAAGTYDQSRFDSGASVAAPDATTGTAVDAMVVSPPPGWSGPDGEQPLLSSSAEFGGGFSSDGGVDGQSDDYDLDGGEFDEDAHSGRAWDPVRSSHKQKVLYHRLRLRAYRRNRRLERYGFVGDEEDERPGRGPPTSAKDAVARKLYEVLGGLQRGDAEAKQASMAAAREAAKAAAVDTVVTAAAWRQAALTSHACGQIAGEISRLRLCIRVLAVIGGVAMMWKDEAAVGGLARAREARAQRKYQLQYNSIKLRDQRALRSQHRRVTRVHQLLRARAHAEDRMARKEQEERWAAAARSAGHASQTTLRAGIVKAAEEQDEQIQLRQNEVRMKKQAYLNRLREAGQAAGSGPEAKEEPTEGDNMSTAREQLELLETQLRQELEHPAADDMRTATFGAPATGATLFSRGGAYRAAGSIDAIVPPPWSRRDEGNSLARAFYRDNGMRYGPPEPPRSRRHRTGKRRKKAGGGGDAKSRNQSGDAHHTQGEGDLYVGGKLQEEGKEETSVEEHGRAGTTRRRKKTRGRSGKKNRRRPKNDDDVAKVPVSLASGSAAIPTSDAVALSSSPQEEGIVEPARNGADVPVITTTGVVVRQKARYESGARPVRGAAGHSAFFVGPGRDAVAAYMEESDPHAAGGAGRGKRRREPKYSQQAGTLKFLYGPQYAATSIAYSHSGKSSRRRRKGGRGGGGVAAKKHGRSHVAPRAAPSGKADVDADGSVAREDLPPGALARPTNRHGSRRDVIALDQEASSGEGTVPLPLTEEAKEGEPSIGSSEGVTPYGESPSQSTEKHSVVQPRPPQEAASARSAARARARRPAGRGRRVRESKLSNRLQEGVLAGQGRSRQAEAESNSAKPKPRQKSGKRAVKHAPGTVEAVPAAAVGPKPRKKTRKQQLKYKYKLHTAAPKSEPTTKPVAAAAKATDGEAATASPAEGDAASTGENSQRSLSPRRSKAALKSQAVAAAKARKQAVSKYPKPKPPADDPTVPKTRSFRARKMPSFLKKPAAVTASAARSEEVRLKRIESMREEQYKPSVLDRKVAPDFTAGGWPASPANAKKYSDGNQPSKEDEDAFESLGGAGEASGQPHPPAASGGGLGATSASEAALGHVSGGQADDSIGGDLSSDDEQYEDDVEAPGAVAAPAVSGEESGATVPSESAHVTESSEPTTAAAEAGAPVGTMTDVAGVSNSSDAGRGSVASEPQDHAPSAESPAEPADLPETSIATDAKLAVGLVYPADEAAPVSEAVTNDETPAVTAPAAVDSVDAKAEASSGSKSGSYSQSSGGSSGSLSDSDSDSEGDEGGSKEGGKPSVDYSPIKGGDDSGDRDDAGSQLSLSDDNGSSDDE